MMRALVVDSRTGMRQILAAWLQELGANVTEAVEAEQALTILASTESPHVAFCDTHLAGRDGIWLAGQLRDTYPQTALVMTTSVRDVDLAVSAFQAGAVDYLVKPFSRDRATDAFWRAHAAHQARTAASDLRYQLETRHAQVTEAMAEVELCTAACLDALVVSRRPDDPGALDASHRCARLAVNLALMLHLREPELSDVERAVFLHAPGRPTAAEQRRLAILKRVPALATAADIALAAHERYDGTGWPHGIRGDRIPLGGRIVAVAIAYDQLLAGGWSPVQALESLRRHQAGEFDPAIVDALARLQPLPALRTQPVRDLHATVPSGDDPRRRWHRKHVARGVQVHIDGHPAQLVEVSYGGLRIETTSALDATPASRFIVELLGLGVAGEAKWVRPVAPGGRYWCGVAVSDEESRVGSRWRAIVDALPPEGAVDQTLA